MFLLNWFEYDLVLFALIVYKAFFYKHTIDDIASVWSVFIIEHCSATISEITQSLLCIFV